jgi:hypothetical protein
MNEIFKFHQLHESFTDLKDANQGVVYFMIGDLYLCDLKDLG